MTEPSASTAVAAASGLTITITGSFIGMPFDSMTAGFVGALIAQTFVPPPIRPVPAWVTSRHGWSWSLCAAIFSQLYALWQLVAAGLLAGLLAPLLASIAIGVLPAAAGAAPVRLAVGGIIGMIAPVVVPILRAMAVKRGDEFKGGGQ